MLEQEQQNLFISTISHELKTPVALIKGYANTLLRTDASWDRATIVEGLQVIDEEADRLDALIKKHAQRQPLASARWLRLAAERGRSTSIGGSFGGPLPHSERDAPNFIAFPT